MPIRETEQADFEVLTHITNDIIATSSTHFGYDPLGPDELASLWRGRGNFPWLTLVHDGAIAGYAKAGTWRTRAAYQWTPETTIYLHANVRGQGLGKPLYVALLDELRSRGFHSVVAGITLPNPASVRLHESLGFGAVGVIKDAGKKFDAWHDVGFWQLSLTAAST